ncbi:putative oxidoreductase YjmC [Porphyridium purpureum]|uniref:Putative oxidoreductase YjmC n=1 Tax=Porphyridium purpureum TaxID=35688 RepID=A0A5J4YN88_PORPP|nr:putative oxidoreductase YjmC [Porphyridium purpureum]|eukprot:POR7346..scf222_8
MLRRLPTTSRSPYRDPSHILGRGMFIVPSLGCCDAVRRPGGSSSTCSTSASVSARPGRSILRASMSADDTVLVEDTVLRSLCVRVLSAKGHAKEDAELVANVLLYAQRVGNTQGCAKLLAQGPGSLANACSGGTPKVVFESGIAAKIDGQQATGMRVMQMATDLALQRALYGSGVGIVGTFNTCTGTGALSYYVEQMAAKKMIGFAFSGSSPFVAPAGSKEPLLGTNPIACAIPVMDDNGTGETARAMPYLLDMSTSAISFWGLKAAQLEAEAASQAEPGADTTEFVQLPDECALDEAGRVTRVPTDAVCLLPFGGHKGSALSLMVEFLTGALVGGAFVDRADASMNFGNLVVAVNPDLFGDGARVLQESTELMQRVRSSLPRDGADRVWCPGDKSFIKREESIRAHKVMISKSQLDQIKKLVQEVK